MRAVIPLTALLAALVLAGCVQQPPPLTANPLIVCRTYLVFFDSDAATLTPRTRELLAASADESRRLQVRTVEIQAHTDRSGSAAYNQRLSQRRAQAVAAELERLGFDRTTMRLMAFGETRPLVPTPDGVAEPQNRRVEIIPR